MQHLQNSVIGRATVSLQLKDMVTVEILTMKHYRNWNPDLVKVTLDRLRKTPHVQNDKPQEVRNLSDVVSTTVWTFKKFGYESDVKAEANISLAVDKLSQELKIKWKDYTKATKLERPSLC